MRACPGSCMLTNPYQVMPCHAMPYGGTLTGIYSSRRRRFSMAGAEDSPSYSPPLGLSICPRLADYCSVWHDDMPWHGGVRRKKKKKKREHKSARLLIFFFGYDKAFISCACIQKWSGYIKVTSSQPASQPAPKRKLLACFLDPNTCLICLLLIIRRPRSAHLTSTHARTYVRTYVVEFRT